MKIKKLPIEVQKSFESNYVKNRVRLLKVFEGVFTFEIIKGLGKGKQFDTNINLLKDRLK